MRGNLAHIFKYRWLPIIAMFFLSPAAYAISNAIKLKISNAVYADETVIRFLPDATKGFDPSYDAWKLFSPNRAVPVIYTTIAPASALCINALPGLLKDEEVEIFTTAGSIGTYTIFATEPGAFPSEVGIFIEDLQTGKIQNLRANPTYTFYVSDTGTFNSKTSKFKIHFSVNGIDYISTQTESFSITETCKLLLNNNILTADFNGVVQQYVMISIYTLEGREITTVKLLNVSQCAIPVNDQSSSAYIVRLQTNKTMVYRKVYSGLVSKR